MRGGGRFEEVRTRLDVLINKYPLTAALHDFTSAVEVGRFAIAELGDQISGGRLDEVDATIEQAYALGFGALALRGRAFSEGAEAYAHAYRMLSQEHGFAVLSAKVRRRAMYFPALAQDDTLAQAIAERMSWRPTFKLVSTTELVKSARVDLVPLDWSPLGGPP